MPSMLWRFLLLFILFVIIIIIIIIIIILFLYYTLDQMQGVDRSVVVLCVWWRVWYAVAFYLFIYFFTVIAKRLEWEARRCKKMSQWNQMKSNKIKAKQIKWNQIRSNQIKSNQIEWNEMKWNRTHGSRRSMRGTICHSWMTNCVAKPAGFVIPEWQIVSEWQVVSEQGVHFPRVKTTRRDQALQITSCDWMTVSFFVVVVVKRKQIRSVIPRYFLSEFVPKIIDNIGSHCSFSFSSVILVVSGQLLFVFLSARVYR